MSDAPQPKSEFDAAKAIAGELTGLEKEQQQRILRWVTESLGITLHVRAPTSHEAPRESAGAEDDRADQRREGGGSTEEESRERTDIKSFVASKAPRSDIQFAAVVAYYYRFEAPEPKEAIDPETLQDATRLANRDRLTKPHLTLNNAKNQGYLDSVGRGLFRINTVGENLVAMALPAGERPRTRGAKKNNSRAEPASKSGKSAKSRKRK